MVIDAGGGTVDLSTYTFSSTTPLAVKEIASPECKSSLLFFLVHSRQKVSSEFLVFCWLWMPMLMILNRREARQNLQREPTCRGPLHLPEQRAWIRLETMIMIVITYMPPHPSSRASLTSLDRGVATRTGGWYPLEQSVHEANWLSYFRGIGWTAAHFQFFFFVSFFLR